MIPQTAFALLAASGLTDYVNPVKILVSAVLLLGWASAAQWVDRDTNVVKTKREQWNLMVLSGGAVAYFILLVIPWAGNLFVVGTLFWAVCAGAPLVFYLVHRNGRVVPEVRLLTPAHFKRLISRGGGPKAAGSGKGVRVKISDHAGKFVERPMDPVDAPAYDLVQDFLFDMLSRRASEIELVAGKEKYRCVSRIDGVATEHPDGISTEDGERIIKYLKKVGGLNVEEIRRPQSGKIQASLLSQGAEGGPTEVRTSGSMAGERLSLHVQQGPVLMRLPDLGIAAARLETVKGFLGKHTGLLLISSPPQHGLTTTQYAIIRGHDAYINNIHALERKKLVALDNITQQVYEGNNTDLNYARMLQSVLRREPDIVLVGECEDHETAKLSARAAADDRKIYQGIQAKDTFDALSRFLTLLNENDLGGKAIIGVVNQRLVRILCKDCREAFQPDAATLKKLNLPADKIERFYRPPSEQKLDRKGRPILCPTCQGTGYVGRTGVFEVLAVDDTIHQLIREGAAINRIKAHCRKNKMYYLQEEGLLKVIDGTTSMNEILRCMGGGEKQA